MANPNRKKKRNTPINQPTYNYAGGSAFKMDKKTELYTRIASCLWAEDGYYASFFEKEQNIINLINDIGENDPEFILKLALYARTVLNLRTIPQIMLCHVAALEKFEKKPKPFVAKYGPKIMQRADDIGIVLGYYTENINRKVPNTLRDAISERLLNLSEYEATKYYKKNAAWSLRDIIRFIHPKPSTPEQSALFNYIVKNEIDEKYLPFIAKRARILKADTLTDDILNDISEINMTWESAISKFGNKKEVWDALDLPFMAMLRNFRNLINSGANIDKYLDRLQSAEQIQQSKQLPFRFLSAYKAILYDFNFASSEKRFQVLCALEKAIELSVENIDNIDGKICVVVDNSASMGHNISKKSLVTFADIAALLASIIQKKNNDNAILVFANYCKFVNLKKDNGILYNAEIIKNTHVGFSTLAYKALDNIDGLFFDKIILLSDMQCYSSDLLQENSVNNSLEKYRKTTNENVQVISVDLAGYGTAQVKQSENTVIVGGWSESILKFINAINNNNWMNDVNNLGLF